MDESKSARLGATTAMGQVHFPGTAVVDVEPTLGTCEFNDPNVEEPATYNNTWNLLDPVLVRQGRMKEIEQVR